MILKGLDLKKKYLLASSGGIDSMVLLHLLLQQGFQFSVIHCNFQLRDKEADLDEVLVKETCTINQIPFFSKKFDTAKYAAETHLSIQVAARQLRYHYFEEVRVAHSFDYILTAHHKNDNIETALFHYLRGSGIKGLIGIPEKRDFVLRPMLHISKNEIIEWAIKHHVSFREDSSNRKLDYTRNKIRLEIIPYLKQFFPEIEDTIADNIKRLQAVNEIYQKEIEKLKAQCSEWRKADLYIFINKLITSPNAQHLLFELLQPFGFSYAQSVEAIKLINSLSGAQLVGKSHRIIKYNSFLIVASTVNKATYFATIEEHNKEVKIADKVLRLESQQKENIQLSSNNHEAFLDLDKIEFPLIVRKWKQGDYLYPLGMSKKKKVARVLIDYKIPLHDKEHILVLESNKKIVWIVNLKPDNRFKVTDKTKKVLKITLDQE